ncbi:MAG: MATE family efflux transporter [Lachnospiraceae bacterium]
MLTRFKHLWVNDKDNIKKALEVAWPAIMESFFVAVVAMIDSFMVSQLGAYAVAAVGLTVQPKFIGLAMFFAINTAVSATIARRKGQGDRKSANELFFSAILAVIVLSIVISTIIVVFADPIIRLIGSEADTHDSAVFYLRIIMGGMIFNVLSLVINAAQRGSGNTRIAMRTNLVSNAVNVVFNYLLIGGNFGFPEWGVAGAAVATVIGTMAACVMSFASLFRSDSFVNIKYIMQEKIRASLHRLLSIREFIANVFLEQIMLRMGFLLSAMITANLGTTAFAINQVGGNVLSISFSFGDGLQVAAVTLIGQSLGQGKPENAMRYGKICQSIGLAISFVIATIYLLFGRMYYATFFPGDIESINIGYVIMMYTCIITLFQISQVIYMGSLRAAGDVKFTTMVSTISVGIVRPAVSFALAYGLGFGLYGIWTGILIDQSIRLISTMLRFRSGKWIHREL